MQKSDRNSRLLVSPWFLARNLFQQNRIISESASQEVQNRATFIFLAPSSEDLGLGWGFGIPATQGVKNVAVRTLLQALFIIFTAFQGLFIFIMQCLRSQIARSQWWKWYNGITGHKQKYDIGKSTSAGAKTKKHQGPSDMTSSTGLAFEASTLGRVTDSSTLQRGLQNDFTSCSWTV